MKQVTKKRMLQILLMSVLMALLGAPLRRAYREAAQENVNYALIRAIQQENVSRALSLLKSGADANAMDVYPARASFLQILEACLPWKPARGPAIGLPALLVLLQLHHGVTGKNTTENLANDTPLLKALLDKGANPNALDNYGEPPLMWAVGAHGPYFHDVVMLLLDKGANPNAADNHGMSVLMFAAQQGDTIGVRRLLDKGARIEARDGNGETPLFRAVEGDNENVARLLIARGANINAKDWSNQTPLYRAFTDGGSFHMVGFLLRNGSNIHIRDLHGRTPLQEAQAQNDPENILLLLREAKAKQSAHR